MIPALLALAALVWTATWGGHYPANMTPDSISQWDQVLRNEYHDWAPVAHTLLIKATSLMWASPAAMIALHISVMLVLLYAVLKEIDALLFGPVAVVTTGLYYALHPIHGTMLSTLVKDVPFSMAVAAYSLALLQIVRSDEPPRIERIVLLAGSGLVVALLRHQGILVVVLSLSGLAALSHARRPGLIVLALLLVATCGWKLMLRQGWHIAGSPITEALAIPLQQAASIAATPGHISGPQRTMMEAVAPWDVWSNQKSIHSIDWLKFDPTFSPAPIQIQPEPYFRLWMDLIRQNPGLATSAVLNQTKVIWNPMQDADNTHNNGVNPNTLGLVHAPWPGPLFSRLVNHSGRLLTSAPISWSVRPSWIHLLLIAAAWVSVRHGGLAQIIPFLPIALLVLTLVALIPTPDFRYFYPAYLTAPLLLAHAASCRRKKVHPPLTMSSPSTVI